MELKNFLLETLYNKACFLCFKTDNNMMNVHDDELEISDKYFNHSINLADIMKILFPTNDIILSKSCTNCTDLLIEMYIVLHRRKYKQNILNVAIDKLGNKLQKLSYLESPKTCTINLSSVSSESINNLTNVPALEKNYHTLETTSKNIISNNSKVEQNILPEDIKNQCPHCLKILKNNKSMLSHIKSHIHTRRKKYYECNNCSYKTLCKNTLEGHINKQHLKIRPFICNTCYKGFFTKSNLAEHIQSHNNIIELCEVCGDVFRQKKSLIMHLRLHSDTRPYECNICGKRFVTSGRRSDHVKRSHLVKTESCLICDKQFGLKKELIRHVKNVHS